MKIVIDCFKQVKGAGKSIGIYNLALNLVTNLIKEKNVSTNSEIKDSEIIVIGNEHNQYDFDMDGVTFVKETRWNPLNKVHCVIWEMFVVPGVCKNLQADRVIFPRGYTAVTHPVYDMVIIHDMIPFYYNENFPDEFNKIENKYIMMRLKQSIKSCKKVITISEASKAEIQKYVKADESKISVIYNGMNALEEDIPASEEGGYISAITSYLPHKNAKGILQAYAEYCQVASEPLDLVVIGISDTSLVELPQDVERKITCHKYIKENRDLHALIAGSEVFLFLSLAEGFGFPPIEAMELNVPVVCSNLSSLPEVVGDAAVLVNPENPVEVAEALDVLIQDKQKQAERVEKGKLNIERFSWESR